LDLASKLNVDASGTLTIMYGGTSQWTKARANIYHNSGNVGT
jgi:hypothetical protein